MEAALPPGAAFLSGSRRPLPKRHGAPMQEQQSRSCGTPRPREDRRRGSVHRREGYARSYGLATLQSMDMDRFCTEVSKELAARLLALVIPVHQLIALTCIINVVMDGCLAGMHFRHCRLSSLWPMLAGSVPGSFAGLYILQICSGAVLQGAVGLLLLYYVYWQKTFRARGTIAHPRALGAVAGFGSGLLGTAIAFDGPPVGAYGLCMGWEPRVLLGTLGVFFVLRATVTLVLQGMAGFYTPTVLTCAMYGAPGVILGTCIAFPVVKHISQQAFRKVLLCVIAVAGLVCLVRALG